MVFLNPVGFWSRGNSYLTMNSAFKNVGWSRNVFIFRSPLGVAKQLIVILLDLHDRLYLLVGSRTHGRVTFVTAKVTKTTAPNASPYGFPAILTNTGQRTTRQHKHAVSNRVRCLSGIACVSRRRISRNQLTLKSVVC